jgi:hypothetical protein
MPSFGMMVTLIAWGYLLDLVGERIDQRPRRRGLLSSR